MPEPDHSSAKSRRKWLLPVVMLVLLLILGVGLWWWLRPIQPVELDGAEVAALEAKLEQLQQPPRYQRGAKEIVLTERELNGLLHRNTQMGDKLRLEFDQDAVLARFETDLSEDLPVVGGKRLKARARFYLREVDGRPSLVLDDVTVWGISLPNEWLGQLKGRDLLAEMLGTGGRGIPGVERLQLQSGRLLIHLRD